MNLDDLKRECVAQWVKKKFDPNQVELDAIKNTIDHLAARGMLQAGAANALPAIKAMAEENKRMREALHVLVDMDDRDQTNDPDRTFTDEGRERAFQSARAALKGE